MSRQAQNILTGVVASMVAIIAVVTVVMSVMGREGESTAASGGVVPAVPAAGVGVDSADGEQDGPQGSLGSEPTTPTPLAVPEEEAAADSSSSTTAVTLPTTVATTEAPATTVATTAAPETTEAPATTEAADASTTVAEGSESTTGSTEAGNAGESSTTLATGSESEEPEETTTTTAAETTTTVQVASGGMNAVELEIARLTNELRTNPNGPLRREGPAIDCNGRVAVNLGTGQYEAIGALTVSETASLQVARPWSAQMRRDNFEHQPNAGVGALQAAGISVRSAGENIAYHNFSNKAMSHFTGWRESDGHFCNMMNGGFTHIGVGEVTKSDGISYATQNFYSTR